MKAIALTSTYWDCPGCKSRVFLRDVVLKFGENQVVGPEEPFECPCGYCLSEKESQPAMSGGCVRPGWWFVCLSCFRDFYFTDSINGFNSLGVATEQPPPVVKCQWCEQENEVSLPEDE